MLNWTFYFVCNTRDIISFSVIVYQTTVHGETMMTTMSMERIHDVYQQLITNQRSGKMGIPFGGIRSWEQLKEK